MRGLHIISAISALTLSLLSAGAASAQSPVSCGIAPQSVCEDQELVALEGERATLVQQLTAADPNHAAIASEQTWVDGLSACGEDVECYRVAYRNHNQTLRDAAAAAPVAADGTSPFEAPADAPPTVDEQIAIDEAQAERLREAAEEARVNTPPRRGDAVYVPVGLPGWGFFTMIAVALLGWWWLTGAIKRNRQALRAEQARLRAWRR
ncbi:MAG TPA: hypothetical protein VFO00_01235 [Vitreimonas sp.]|nr:hypothetical protein [Vitreimonas sp.]